MTDNGSVEKSERNIEQENNNCIVLEGATETETSDFFEESSVVYETFNKESTSDFESDSDVINSFIQNTNNEVGTVVVFKYILRQL